MKNIGNFGINMGDGKNVCSFIDEFIDLCKNFGFRNRQIVEIMKRALNKRGVTDILIPNT